MPRDTPLTQDAFRVFCPLQTRWNDTDVYGHLNNTVHYQLFDTAVNGWLMEQGLLDPQTSDLIGLVVNSQCSYFASLKFTDPIRAGLSVDRLGTSSVTYKIAIFGDSHAAAAQGTFTHVMVDRNTRRPQPMPDALRTALEKLMHSV